MVEQKRIKKFAHASAPRRYRIRVTDGNGAAGLFVSDEHGTPIPAAKCGLCQHQDEPTEYFHDAAVLRQEKLKEFGFSTELEQVRTRKKGAVMSRAARRR